MSSTLTTESALEWIQLHGVRVHNLKNIDVALPRNQLVVITGPSGSGKSSLAFDTLFAEGQRRYIESLSTFARPYLDQMERPDVDLIEGLQPTLAIEQHQGSFNPRSTVATVTEIYDYLRLLYARAGEVTCHQCGAPIRQQSTEQILAEFFRLPEGTKVMLLAPLVRGRRGQHKEVFEKIRKAGFVRARVNGDIYDLENVPELKQQMHHDVEAVVDRLVVRPGVQTRAGESLRLTLQHGQGAAVLLWQQTGASTWEERLFNTKFACLNCNLSFPELEPRSFSFNSPYGACATCEGLASVEQFDPELVVPQPELSLEEGAIAPWRNKSRFPKAAQQFLDAFVTTRKIDRTKPWYQLTEKQRRELLWGDEKHFLGILALLEQQWQETKSAKVREHLESFRGLIPCPACQGARLRPEARAVKLGGKAIHETTAMTVRAALEWYEALSLQGTQELVGEPLRQEVVARLRFLQQVGVSYLTLDRGAQTLSGGEAQRIRLASSIGSALVGVCYVLDEPSIGLHPRDNHRLVESLRELQRQGNSVIVVEHDEALMRQADYLIDLGPGAGQHGGQVIAAGPLEQVLEQGTSVTAEYLQGIKGIPTPQTRRLPDPKRTLTLVGARENNLQSVTAEFPLGLFICVTGVSGSGKSTLVNQTLACALRRGLHNAGPKPGEHEKLLGLEHVQRVIQVDQAPIGRNPRSNPATYTGVFDEIRKLFAATKEAKLRGFQAGRFSFNVKGGRCTECLGQGMQRIEMNFLPDLWITCPQCRGKRFNRATLAVKYRGKSIADILEMQIDEAVTFFENISSLQRMLRSLNDVGLGYLTLGQSSTTLSGGESQRIKLATELGRATSGDTVYILDEPTTGLHFADIQNLLQVLSCLVDAGNTVIVIEHQLDVIKSADWILDIGPEGGSGGGKIVASGPPEAIAQLQENHTGRFLKELLEAGVSR